MACVEAAIPVPNSRKKTDELFLYWLSESSTQELLRKELANITGVPYSELDDKAVNEAHAQHVSEYGNTLSPSSAVTNVLRPGSPNMRTPSPPLLSHRSPKSPRGAVRNRSPKKQACKSPSGKYRAKNGLQHSFDEVDSGDDAMGVGPSAHLHLHNYSEANQEGTELLDMTMRHDRRARSHSPKPDSLPVGPRLNHGPIKVVPHSSHIPRFYFPNGKPRPEENLQESFVELGKFFQSIEGGEASFNQFADIMKVSALRWWLEVVVVVVVAVYANVKRRVNSQIDNTFNMPCFRERGSVCVYVWTVWVCVISQ